MWIVTVFLTLVFVIGILSFAVSAVKAGGGVLRAMRAELSMLAAVIVLIGMSEFVVPNDRMIQIPLLVMIALLTVATIVTGFVHLARAQQRNSRSKS